MQPRTAAVYTACCAGLAVFSFAFALPLLVPMHTLWYLPLEHEWRFAWRVPGPAMDFFGRLLTAGLASIPACGLGAVAGGRFPPGPRAARVWFGVAMSTFVMAVLAYGAMLASREPVAEPLPTWYVPR